LSSLIEVATGPITGEDVLYSLLKVILIGPITASAELVIKIADKAAIKIVFLVNILTPYKLN
jgi:hypothetical protein